MRAKGTIFVCMLLVAAGLFAGKARASDLGSLTLKFHENSSGFSGAEFQIYDVGSVSSDGSVVLENEFAQYPVSLENLNSSGWRDLAQTLAAYVRRDDLEPLAKGITDEKGDVIFGQLMPGLYLADGENYRRGGNTYTPEPVLIALPGKTAEGSWTYHPVSEIKYQSRRRPGDGGDEPDENRISLQALKIWEDSGAEDIRPEQVQIQLLRNGEIYEQVILNEENNWSWSWEGLDGDSRWEVAEKDLPDGYTVRVSRQGNVFAITNTCRRPLPLATSSVPQPPDESSSPQLPQTGVLWWPVSFLAGGGLGFIMAGWGRRKGKRPAIAVGTGLLTAALGLTGYNLWDGQRAAAASHDILNQMGKLETSLREIPDDRMNLDRELPDFEIQGTSYIGYLEIPGLHLILPVASCWSYPELKKSPCRYTGSPYKDSLVIAGHNYQSHFGGLKSMAPGDTVIFTDAEGNRFTYKATGTEILEPDAVQEMTTGPWDLTLFTCTYSGRKRMALRCERV